MKLLLFLSLFFSLSCFSKSFEDWKKEYIIRASKRGIPKSFSTEVLKDVIVDYRVIKKDKNQILSSNKHSYPKFMKKWLRDGLRVKKGIELLKTHSLLLDKVEAQYGVDKEVIVALWGIETLYGEIKGDYNVIRSLASLAFEGRRRSFYETQLNAAIRIIKKGYIKQSEFKGSWAGATGHCQFMPSNLFAYGKDFNKDGIVDIWNSLPDVFASIANLLKKAGWSKNKSIGSLAKPPSNLNSNFNYEKYRSPIQLNKLGFRDSIGRKLHSSIWSSRRIANIPMSDSPVVLRGSNYLPLMKWNRSSLFAAFNIILINEFKK